MNFCIMGVVLMNDLKVDLFKNLMYEYFLNKADQLEDDRKQILSRVSLDRLDSDSYYDLIVNDIRSDLLRSLSREIKELMLSYL